MTRIDVGSVLRDSAKLPYADLVTRPTGAAVRRCIELELAGLEDGEIAMLDFSKIGMIDYSCADEVVAKLLLAHKHGETQTGYVVFHGITDAHLEAIEDVLNHHALALVVHFADGAARLVGTVSDEDRGTWEHVRASGPSSVEDVAKAEGADAAVMAERLHALHRRRLLRYDGSSFSAPNVAHR